jgi:hypothetical protein
MWPDDEEGRARPVPEGERDSPDALFNYEPARRDGNGIHTRSAVLVPVEVSDLRPSDGSRAARPTAGSEKDEAGEAEQPSLRHASLSERSAIHRLKILREWAASRDALEVATLMRWSLETSYPLSSSGSVSSQTTDSRPNPGRTGQHLAACLHGRRSWRNAASRMVVQPLCFTGYKRGTCRFAGKTLPAAWARRHPGFSFAESR